MYTKEERETAQALVANESYMKLLVKVFTEQDDKLNPDVVLAKTNEQLGEIVRAGSIAEEKIKNRLDTLKKLAVTYKGKGVNIPE